MSTQVFHSSAKASVLHTASGTYDLPAIMRRAWAKARSEQKLSAKLGFPMTTREAIAYGLKQAWDEARSARSLAKWQIEQDTQHEAMKALDARTREIAALRFARAAADGIDSTPRFLAEVRAIETRLAELGA